MSDMKCPFCQQELEQITTSNPLGLGRIEMAVCKKCMDKGVLHIMPIWDWQELIRARKALDEAKKWLMKIGYLDMTEHGLGSENMMTDWCKTVALYGLKEIETVLEQKDAK